MKILVSGSSGFLGKHLMPRLIQYYGESSVIGVRMSDYDLTDPNQFDQLLKYIRPDVFYHLAAYSGGIGANKKYPADFYYINNLLTAHGFHYAAKYSVQKFIYTMGGCSYPATAKSPIDETQMWQGYPQSESAAYSSAKKMGIVAGEAYRIQKNLNSMILIPGNMYGEFDNYSELNSHVIPGMIRRFHEAKINSKESITMWGTGKPTRDFVYAGDVADCMMKLEIANNMSSPINISTGTSTSIIELANLISSIMEYRGRVLWDDTKPDGQMNKIFSVQKLNDIGLSCPTSLLKGLTSTIKWYEGEYKINPENIRLE